MPNLDAIIQRLHQLTEGQQHSPINDVVDYLASQHYHAQLPAEFVHQSSQAFQLSTIDFALACLPIAACYALTPVSHFRVGAVAIGESGIFYFGANQEFEQEAISHTIHAEQSAIAHAWLAGESKLTDIVVNYTPCGHCRQFMNELNNAAQLNIHLPHSQHQPLHHYLPDAFGPKDLNMTKALFDAELQSFELQGDTLTQTAIWAAAESYAPYSAAFSGVALACGDYIIRGRYAENAAFNPSLLPLQSALNFLRLNGREYSDIKRIVLAEKQSVLSSRSMTVSLAKQVFDGEVEYVRF